MSAVDASELQPGIVVHLDTDVLRELGGCKTNAAIVGDHDRAVTGAHYFLILEINDKCCTAAPLYSKYAQGNILLVEDLKGGLRDKWIGQVSYVSQWQQWKIPVSHIQAASQDEESNSSNRRTYAVNEPLKLEKILSLQAENECPYRDV